MAKKKDIRNGTPQIVILPNGFVVFGVFTCEDDLVTIERSSIIRRWGTVKGMGEIAINGPGKETVLDFLGTSHTYKKAIIFTITCNILNWRKTLCQNTEK